MEHVLLNPRPDHSDFSRKIAFLHGIACTHQVWSPLIAKLPKGWSSFAPDQRFHGEQRQPATTARGFFTEDYARDLLETMKQTGFFPAWLVGHSMGARVAVAAARLHGEGICGLILVDHPVVPSEAGKKFRIQFREFLRSLPLQFPSEELAMGWMKANCPDPSSPGVFIKSFSRKPDGNVELQLEKDAILKSFDALPLFPYVDSLHALGRLKKPVLMIRGATSPFWSSADWEKCRESFSQYPSFQFCEMKDAGHGLPFERGDQFLEAIFAFIDGTMK